MCGLHLPFNEKESERLLRENVNLTQLFNNCSGKHAAMLAFAKHINADTDRYLQTGTRYNRQYGKQFPSSARFPQIRSHSELTAAVRRISPCRYRPWHADS
jgi:L-asparaginase II